MEVTIPKITLNIFEVWGNEEMEEKFEQQEQQTKRAWESIYNGIAAGKSSIAYFDANYYNGPGFSSFMRYALHRSPKKDGFLQLSVMEIRDGEIIPTRDEQFDCAEKFLRSMIGRNGQSVIIR